jgi:redox-sensitive bicupin YhaK (pirin superfamily)
MLTVRKSSERGHFDHGWLDTTHTFSFADYHDPKHMGFRSLRVINEDRVAPGQGFGTHGHRDMEIVTVVLEGALEHKDSIGTGAVIHAGEVQRMTAGTGVRHSEFNHSRSEEVHFLQIWLLPERQGLTPSYEQKEIPETPGLRLLASRDGKNGALTVHQDVSLWGVHLAGGAPITYDLAPERHAWLQITSGAMTVNGVALAAGDGLAVSAERRLELTGSGAGLLFDLG